jgi:formate dehydrogenase major subunit
VDISRRDFLKLSGASAGGLVAYQALAPGSVSACSSEVFPLEAKVAETTTMCAYCAGGCGAIISTYADGILKVEGDPDHPINLGSLCSKAQALPQLHQVDGEINPRRLTKPLYRAAGGDEWQEKTWDEAINGIAAKIKATRDAGWIATEPGTTNVVNRTEAVASLGGAALDNEECYVLSKMLRSLGLVFLEHQARI